MNRGRKRETPENATNLIIIESRLIVKPST